MIKIELDEKILKKIIHAYIIEQLGRAVKIEEIHIETKSAQNYKATREQAEYRARYEGKL